MSDPLVVAGRCPACGGSSLFLGSGGYVTCSRSDCPVPDAAASILEDGETYTVRVQWLGKSDWVLAGTATVIANPVDPVPPTSFGAMAVGNDVHLDWINAEEGFYRTRIYRGTSLLFNSAVPIKEVDGNAGQPSSTVDSGLSPETYRYWAATVNASGLVSTPVGPETVTIS